MVFGRVSAVVLIAAALGLSACGGATGPADTAILLKEQMLEPGPLGEREYGSRNAPVTII